MKKTILFLLVCALTPFSFAREKLRSRILETPPTLETNANNVNLENLEASPLSSKGDSKGSSKRFLANSTKEEDLAHYQSLDRRLGVDIGMFIPMGDFQSEFQSAPLIGIHFIWEAIAPWALAISTHRASTTHKSGAAGGKLTVSNIAIGTQATFSNSRFIPYIKMQGSFDFNDVSFGTTKTVTAGNDTFLTTVGLEVGGGWDFIVGREISFGLEAKYHYGVSKKITLSTGEYDLGSSYATAAFRINF